VSFNVENITLEDALAHIKALENKIAELEQQNANLTELIVKSQKKMFGKSSEQLRVLKRNGQQVDGQSRQWVFCTGKYSDHRMALYYHHATRSAKVVKQILGEYTGFLQTDGCASYNAAVKATHVGCWTHAKRKWAECLPKGIDDKNSKAVQALELIERIFAATRALKLCQKMEDRLNVNQN